MKALPKPVVGYVSVVLGVIAMAAIAVLNLRATPTKAYRHWDADIQRIIARQQAKKQDTISVTRTALPDIADEAVPQLALLTGEPPPDRNEAAAIDSETSPQKAQRQSARKQIRRTERRHQQYASAVFAAAVPKFVAMTSARTTLVFRVR